MSWYRINLEPDSNDTLFVTAPEFPEVASFGEDTDQALINGRLAIEEALTARIGDGMELPPPLGESPGTGHFVQLPALTYLKVALYSLCRERGITRAELSRRLDWHREQVDRLFRLDHNSRLGQIEDAFKAIGVDLQIRIPELEDA